MVVGILDHRDVDGRAFVLFYCGDQHRFHIVQFHRRQ